MPDVTRTMNLDIGSYWEASVGKMREDPSLVGEARFDVAVVGAGFAGLSAALRLAGKGASVCVLDAGRVGWGASGRNGGFCCLGGTKYSEAELVRRFGLEAAKALVCYQIEAIETVSERLKTWGLDANRHSQGEMLLAHRPSDFKKFAKEATFLKQTFGYNARVLSREDLQRYGMAGPAFMGGLYVPHGFALNPMKYVHGLAAKVRARGGRIFSRTPVTNISPDGAKWRLTTPEASIDAQKVILAGNGYAHENVPKWLHGRTLPVMSSVLVTRPLTDEELAAQGWTTDLMASDTRVLLHYFRLMPDRRFLFGTRGGAFESDAALSAMQQRGRADFERLFPAWKSVETESAWHGNVCLSRNLTPFVGAVPGMDGLYAAMAWHGSGIAMASHSGEKVADVVLGTIAQSDLPSIISNPLKQFPVPSLRKAYLEAAYLWYGLRDARIWG